MLAKDIVEHFLSRSPWVDREKTVDRVIIGDPEGDFSRCMVTWISSMPALEEAVARGIRLVITHEPTFWDHLDKEQEDLEDYRRKVSFIRENGLTIIRNHDCWDRWPGIGIPFAWAKFLGIDTPPVGKGFLDYMHRYDIEPASVDELAGRFAKRCAEIGEPIVQVIGDGKRKVSRIGIGTGCICYAHVFRDMGCDCAVVSDDGTCYWANIQRAADADFPQIRMNHGTTEEPGMVTLTEYINANLDGLTAEHLPHGASFRLVGVDGQVS